MLYQPQCIPGIPIKRYSPCVNPLQTIIPHIISVFKTKNDKLVFEKYMPNLEYYSEYAYFIQQFIDKELDNSPRLIK